MSASQQVTGIASGFDTAGIVEQLMKIEKIPYEKLDIKKQTQQLKKQAYQAVNSMLLKFRTSVGTLSSQKLWKSKTASSTNEKSLTATANEYAVNGSYSFKVAQLATVTQYMSKGFASSKTAFVKQAADEEPYKLGTISMNSAKSRVDTSAKLDTLNGGKGVYRGSVRITDGANRTSIIDLSGCDTMDDVVRTLNESTNAQITASIQNGKLHIADESGSSGTMKIQNVGSGTTATDLGINGSGVGSVSGRNVYTLGSDMSLGLLQDGLGVEEGMFTMRVSDGANYIDVAVNVDDCNTVGDIMKRVNQEIDFRYQNNIYDENGGGFGGTLLEGLRFGIVGDDKNSFGLTGTKAGYSYQFYNDENNAFGIKQEPATQLGLTDQVKTAVANGDELQFGRVLGDVNSPMLKNLAGTNGTGIGAAGQSSMVPVAFGPDTLISHLNQGKGLDISRPLSIQLSEGGSDGSDSDGLKVSFADILDPTQLYSIVNAPGAKLSDLVNFMNQSLADYAADPANKAAGLAGMSFDYDTYNNRMVVVGAQGGYKVEIAGTMAAGLGLTRADSYRNTGIEIDSTYYSDYTQRKDAIDQFYGLNGYAPNSLLSESGKQIEFTGDNITKLYDLMGMHGVDITQPGSHDAAINASLATLLGQPLNLEIVERDNAGNAIRTRSVSVDLSSLGFDADTTAEDFIKDVNAAIQAAFDLDATTNSYATISAPQLRVGTYGDSLQWSNMNFTNDFTVKNNALSNAMGLTTGSTDHSAIAADFKDQMVDAIVYDCNPWGVGYLDPQVVDSTTASTIRLGDLNNGAHLTFAGNETDELNIELGDGKNITITMKDLRDMINARSSLNTSLQQYVDDLNALVAAKISADPALAGVTLEFQVGDGKMEITNVTGAERLIVSGAAADATKTGIGPVNIDIGVTAGPGTVYEAGKLEAAVYQLQTIDGLGEIKIDLGGSVQTLNTTGLDENSTLADLVDTLNQQLQTLGGDFAEVRFTINTAGTGIAIDNGSSKALKVVDTQDAQKLAQDLGLIDNDGKGVEVDSFSFHNSESLNRRYMSRATKLSDYLGAGDPGVIKITNAFGASWDADLSDCKTIGDVIDYINQQEEFGVQVQLNERGDGFDVIEAYAWWNPPTTTPTGNISISDQDGGSIAKKLGLAGTGDRDHGFAGMGNASVYRNSQKVEIDVMSTDTLESLMYRISEKGGYKTAIVNDGSGNNPYRLTIASATTGEASDFVIESDLEMFGFNQTSRAKDSKVLYGDPNSSASPVMLSSSTNSNSNAILGLTLDLKSVSSEYTTITVDIDKEKVVEEIKNMVQTYNDLNDIVSYLDAYDEETGEPGVLFGDSSVRTLMEDINDMFYLIFNPNQKLVGSVNDDGVLNTWTWMDLGVSLSAKNSNSDGSGNWYSSMDLDLDKLDEMVAKNWDLLYNMMAGQRNASNSTLDESVKASAAFNGKAAKDFSVDNAINGDSNKGSWGINNGFMADGTIADGENEYTIYFQKNTTVSRLSIYHFDSDTALKNFTVEYLDASTGKWETLRDVTNNSVDANHFGMALPTAVSAIRIKADSTNASDGKFRLLDVQVFEDIGLAGQLNHLTSRLGDTQLGFLAERTEELDATLADIDEQMLRLQERLDAKEANLWKRFTAMETALGQLQNQSSYFSTMMDSLSTNKK